MEEKLQDATAEAKIHFKRKDLPAAKRLLRTDLGDTYVVLTDNLKAQVSSITQTTNEQHYSTFLKNTNFAITSLHILYRGAFECVKRHHALPRKRLYQIKQKHDGMVLIDEKKYMQELLDKKKQLSV